MDYIRNITNESTSKEFVLKIEFLPKKQEKIDFKFSNNLHLLEKRILKIESESNQIIFPYSIKSIIPKSLDDVTNVIISPKKPFVYFVKGGIIDKDDKFLLDFKSVEYLLDKGVRYYIFLESENNVSNKIIFEY